jgi:hypothetical protein
MGFTFITRSKLEEGKNFWREKNKNKWRREKTKTTASGSNSLNRERGKKNYVGLTHTLSPAGPTYQTSPVSSLISCHPGGRGS